MGLTAAPELAPGERARLVVARLDALRQLLDRHRAAGMLLETRRDFAWLTIGGLNHVLLSDSRGAVPIVVTADRALALAPVNESARIAAEELDGLPLALHSLPWWQPDAAASVARELTAGRALLDPSAVAPELEELRTALVPVEHRRMEWLGAVAMQATTGAMSAIVPGQLEHQLAAEVIGRLSSRGLRVPVLLVAGDERISRYRHPLPANAPIERRAMVVVVVEQWGLHAAHTQFVEFQPRPADVDRRAAALAEVLAAMRAATIIGRTLGDVFEAARGAYAAHGLGDEWALHHQGGSIGYQARERIAQPGDPTPIRPGMAFAWNPSAVGYKREETLYLDTVGAQHVVTTTPD